MIHRFRAGLAIALTAVAPPLAAQPLEANVGTGVVWPESEFSLPRFEVSREGWPQVAEPTPSIGLATALSAALPGAGQHALGQPRAWAYVALEAAGWFGWVNRRSAGADARTAYRDFAWEVGRIQSGPRSEGDFDYYETMSNWDRSGAFDADPGSTGVQPETDVTTFNGAIWALATRLFPDPPGNTDPTPRPEALEYYLDRAYGSDLVWDWTMAGAGARGDFAELIEESDAKYRQATNVLGLIIANHVVSAVDAFVSSRARAHVSVAPMQTPAGSAWGFTLTVPTR